MSIVPLQTEHRYRHEASQGFKAIGGDCGEDLMKSEDNEGMEDDCVDCVDFCGEGFSRSQVVEGGSDEALDAIESYGIGLRAAGSP